jgi:hypothetical protein
MAVREIILTAQHSTLTAPFFLSDKGDNLI